MFTVFAVAVVLLLVGSALLAVYLVRCCLSLGDYAPNVCSSAATIAHSCCHYNALRYWVGRHVEVRGTFVDDIPHLRNSLSHLLTYKIFEDMSSPRCPKYGTNTDLKDE